MKRYKMTIGLFIAILLIFSLYNFSARRNATRTVENVSISFLNLYEPIISEKNVNKLLIQNNREFLNMPLEKLDLNERETQLRNYPMVRAAEVSLSIDGKVEAVVEPRKPIARIMSVPNMYLDADNSLMPLSAEYTVLVPLVYGYKEATKDSLFELLNAVRNNAILKATITEVRLSDNDEVFMAVRAYDYKVELGTVAMLEHKLKNYKAFVAKMIKDNGLQDISTIDLRYKGQVVVVKK
jgi:cell division protein FtsQ